MQAPSEEDEMRASRVLIVDDSLTIRAMVEELLGAACELPYVCGCIGCCDSKASD